LACSDQRIRRTGRGWEDWFALLDSWEAESLGHLEVVRRVAAIPDVSAWEAQAVATSFERASGMRAVGQRIGPDGYVATASKTMAAPAEQVFMAFVEPSRRAGWLCGLELSERTVSKPKTARFDVGDGSTRLLLTVEAKGPSKCTVAVEHSRLSGSLERETRQAFWRKALAALKREVERGT
jgi:hypothetical protein